MTPNPDHLDTLIRYQAWRKEMPDPKEIGMALDWAIKELEAVRIPKRTP